MCELVIYTCFVREVQANIRLLMVCRVVCTTSYVKKKGLRFRP